MRRFWLGLFSGLLLSILAPTLILASGLINFAATSSPTAAEVALAKFAVTRSISRRVSETENPFKENPQAVASGFHHYADTCLGCHGAPGISPKEFAQGLNPPAPKLTDSLGKLDDAELFWIIKHGIRMTGMPALGPTHTDDDIWKVVAFVRHLPNLSNEERAKLKEAIGEGHQHGDTSTESVTDANDDHDHSGHSH